MNEQRPRYAPPWIFGITNLPFGVSGTYAAVAMPFFLRKAGLPIETVAAIGALAFMPAAWQLFWAPVLDLGIRRRSWLILCSGTGAVCLGMSMLLNVRENLLAYEILMVIGQALVGLVSSCNGALVSTQVDPAQRGKAAGWVNAANLGASALGGGVVLTLANYVSMPAAALALVLLTFLPSLVALLIPEPPPLHEPLVPHLKNMGREVWRAVSARRGWTGLLFCLSPVGTVALTNLLSAMASDYGASGNMVALVNGYGGGFVTAAGALITGFLIDHVDKRKVYLAAGVLTTICCTGMALAPMNTTTYIVGSLCYLLIAGLAYAAFSAVVYEIVGTAGNTASTLYSVFPAAGNQAIAYTLALDGIGNHRWGTRGLLCTDAALNMIGVALLLLLLRVIFRDKKAETSAKSEPVPEVAVLTR
jgi:PAT family beta-lactamase induction signal transducer AmpG